jgi:predicted small metal-binding protein
MQTGCPFRGYKIEFSIYTEHFREVEKKIHKHFNASHEWVDADLDKIIKKIKQFVNLDNALMKKINKLKPHQLIVNSKGERICYNYEEWCELSKEKKAYLFKHPKLKQEIIDWMTKDIERGDIKYFKYFSNLFKEHRFSQLRGFYGIDFKNKVFNTTFKEIA